MADKVIPIDKFRKEAGLPGGESVQPPVRVRDYYPLEKARQMAEDHYGDVDWEQGKLTMTFSREITGDANLKLFISEIFGLGLFKGEHPPCLSFDCFEQLSPEHPTGLANNASMRSGQNPDHVIIEIQAIDLA
ncbi:MAG: hypothetical protein KA099_09700 [Alphaproteobacteria bacterium]|nr:hypothetical protein [Alphaproteobacteria bacterium]MBP7759533.1 hypothetical protein [Alphaproteobacteria bacterium]MBP7762895.1 hypothetical protein [Alphaproteobacteria bacterium]MBP7905588.1 hypothetical protein [Alphaproteobacteria bacterium]